MGICNTTEMREACGARGSKTTTQPNSKEELLSRVKFLNDQNPCFGLGAVESARRRGQFSQLYGHYDINHNNKISLEEFTTMARAFEGNSLPDDVAEQLYKKIDGDATELSSFFLMKTAKLSREDFDHLLETTWLHEASAARSPL